MSEDKTPSASPSAAGSTQGDPLRQIRHDLRHALYVLDLALTLLADSRTDEARFTEVLEMLRKEQATINTHVEELLELASDHRGSNSPAASSTTDTQPQSGQAPAK